tara:strand:+ start:2200 stop:2799 length:600 start_codon:yes stop_codon:yes gene_type:complete
MPFKFFKMTAANKPTGAYSRPRTGSSYTSTKIYKTDERGRRVVAGTRVGTYDKRQDRIVYTYRPVVERRKPTMSNFLATLFKPVIDRKIAGKIAEESRAMGGRLEKDDTVTIPFKGTTPPTREEIKKYQALSDEARKKEEKKPSRFGDLGMPDLSKYKSYESLVDQGLMGSGTDISQQIDKLFNPGNLTLKDLRFNRGR